MLPPVQSDNLRQLKSYDVLRIDSFYFLLIDIVNGCLRVVGPGNLALRNNGLSQVRFRTVMTTGARTPDIRPPSVGADGTDSRFTLDKTVEWKVIV
ncbi:MAG TPA: hypothetical protein VNO32_13020 [Candidatus Acidoferrum sp.]|nr:hypothetical protein [Candidatus Acidoferrum sp.]